MNLARNARAARLIAATALLALAAPVIAGTVVASSGPSAGQFRVGSQIASNQRVTLLDGDSVTVLDNGSTRVLRGPGSTMLARRSAAADSNAFAALTTQRRAGQARGGAVRDPALGLNVRNPNLWYVDIARSGTICLADPANVRLWRADTTAAASLDITAPGAAPRSVSFPEREMLARWGRNEAPREGVTYTVGTSQIAFKFLASVPEDADAMAQALIDNGCMVQLEQMSEALLDNS